MFLWVAKVEESSRGVQPRARVVVVWFENDRFV